LRADPARLGGAYQQEPGGVASRRAGVASAGSGQAAAGKLSIAHIHSSAMASSRSSSSQWRAPHTAAAVQ